MSQNDQPQEKRAWRAPEIVQVGGVLDVTEAVTENLRDNPTSTNVNYRTGSTDGSKEVELED